jgi:hypothetical protein
LKAIERFAVCGKVAIQSVPTGIANEAQLVEIAERLSDALSVDEIPGKPLDLGPIILMPPSGFLGCRQGRQRKSEGCDNQVYEPNSLTDDAADV